MTNQQKLISNLNNLLTKNYDAETGFTKVAEKTEVKYLKDLFKEKAQLHSNMGHQLKQEIRQLGGEVEKGGSAAGAAHRAWIDVKTFFSLDDEEALLESCITGETNCANDYKDTLEDMEQFSSTRQLLHEQWEKVMSSVERMKREEERRD